MKRRQALLVCSAIFVVILAVVLIASNYPMVKRTSEISVIAQGGNCLYVMVVDRGVTQTLGQLFVFAEGSKYPVSPNLCEETPNWETSLVDDGRATLGQYSVRGGRLTGPEIDWQAPNLKPPDPQ